MDYVVYGAGAVGGVVGARLALSGARVSLVARGAHLAAIREHGLVLDAGDGRHTVEAAATDTAAEVDWTGDTVVVLAVKSHQAAVALDDLRRHAPAETPSSVPPTASPPRWPRCASSPARTPCA